ncbi:Mov34/MPN/PAD-1 family protein [Sphingosinicella soli]|uniref:Proteasome lid subunit RPN8/RPN11 n=1 Tax=Sphingosinicella soli TaxID=333708 RepID=A0A7W7B2L5_9SPHN|nr:M67 family metallopeptidase [Sphingosinicella soli]MBB4632890.1 proteasome lid subunit RPN8/RPN11 [Sphingosinicella soli]
MTVRIARHALAEIRADCAARAPEEACGLLLGQGGHIERGVAAPNVADERLRHFEIDPAALFAAHRGARSGGPAILGCYHSHPGALARPSRLDAQRALDAGWIWLILGQDGEKAYRVVANGSIHGRFEAVAIEVVGKASVGTR